MIEKLTEYTGLTEDQIIVLSKAGSHMYGTSTPDSDEDYLGIYRPTRRQFLLQEYPKQASYPKDSGLDVQIWSIHYFLKLALAGETLSIDLLHAPDECLVTCDPDIWYDLTGNRTKFHTQQMKAFVSYARKQAAKYGIKGHRIETLENVIKYLDNCCSFNPFHLDGKLRDVWANLPTGDHIHFLDTEPYKMYQVCGKKFQETVKITYIREHLQKSLDEYGKRAQQARENKGVDWKAVSHAIRACDQVYDIITIGDYCYPLRNADFIKSVKIGHFDFTTVVQPYLENAMNEIERLIGESHLPEKPDKDFWDKWLMIFLKENVLW